MKFLNLIFIAFLLLSVTLKTQISYAKQPDFGPLNAKAIVSWLMVADDHLRDAVLGAIEERAGISIVDALLKSAFELHEDKNYNDRRKFANVAQDILEKLQRAKHRSSVNSGFMRFDQVLIADYAKLQKIQDRLCSVVSPNLKSPRRFWQTPFKNAVRDIVVLNVAQGREREIAKFIAYRRSSIIGPSEVIAPLTMLSLRLRVIINTSRTIRHLDSRKSIDIWLSEDTFCTDNKVIQTAFEGRGYGRTLTDVHIDGPLAARSIVSWIDQLPSNEMKALIAALEPIQKRRLLSTLSRETLHGDMSKIWFIRKMQESDVVDDRKGLWLRNTHPSTGTEAVMQDFKASFINSKSRLQKFEELIKSRHKKSTNNINAQFDLLMLYYLQQRSAELTVILEHFSSNRGNLDKARLSMIKAIGKSVVSTQPNEAKSRLQILVDADRRFSRKGDPSWSKSYLGVLSTVRHLPDSFKHLKGLRSQFSSDEIKKYHFLDTFTFHSTSKRNKREALHRYWLHTKTILSKNRRENTRRALFATESELHDLIFSVATHNDFRGTGVLGDAVLEIMLNWKGAGAEELAKLYQEAQNKSLDDTSFRIQLEKIRNLRSKIAYLYHGANDHTKALYDLEAREFSLLSRMQQFQTSKSDIPTIENLKSSVNQNDLFVTFRTIRRVDVLKGTYGARSIIMAVLKGWNKETEVFDLGTQSEITNLVTKYTSKDVKERRNATKKLSEKILEPLKTDLGIAKTIYLSPDGPLHLVPFDALLLPNGQYWVETHDLRRLSNDRVFLRKRNKSISQDLFLGFGGALYDSTKKQELALRGLQNNEVRITALQPFKYLQETKKEVEELAAFWKSNELGPATAIVGEKFTESMLQRLVREGSPRVLHIASHGFFLSSGAVQIERPSLMAGIAMTNANAAIKGLVSNTQSDGIFWALEASNLPLQNTELVVLSACDTAKGVIDAGEGVYGLGRAFQIAGANNVLLTLWALYDKEARLFMLDFYKTWLSEHYSDPADALRATKLSWIRSGDSRRSAPEYWAPYILMQNGR